MNRALLSEFFSSLSAVWSSLPVDLRSLDIALDIFKEKLKTFLSELSTRCAFEALANLRGTNCLIEKLYFTRRTVAHTQ